MLVLNSNNVVAGSNNTTYQYKFSRNMIIKDEAEMAISSVTIPYSWYNITARYANNVMSFYFPTTAGYVAEQIVFDDGYYSVVDINARIQQECINEGYYLINASGQYVYYLTLLYNPTTYGVQLICQPVPTSLPSGWSQPSNWNGFPTTTLVPILQVDTAEFGKLIGFTTGLYPPNYSTITNYNVLNTFTPIGSNINNLIIRSSLVDNEIGFPTDIVDSMAITSTFGSNINYVPPVLKWVKLSAGIYQYFNITFVDQNLNNIYALDNNVCITLMIRNHGSVPPLEDKGLDLVEMKSNKISLNYNE
jgi:hypothetical protein